MNEEILTTAEATVEAAVETAKSTHGKAKIVAIGGAVVTVLTFGTIYFVRKRKAKKAAKNTATEAVTETVEENSTDNAKVN